MSPGVDILLLAFSAALNPTLLAATTVMLLLPRPRNLMLGYLLGAMMTSVSLGLVIVFSLEDSGAVEATQNTFSPAADIVLGVIFLIVARALSAERDAILRERRKRRRAAKGKAKREKSPPRWQQALSRGTPRTTGGDAGAGGALQGLVATRRPGGSRSGSWRSPGCCWSRAAQ